MDINVKKLVFSGLLAASLFSETTAHTTGITRMASGIVGLALLPVTAAFAELSLENTTSALLINWTSYKTQSKFLTPDENIYARISWKSWNGSFELSKVIISFAALLYTNYKLFKYALSSPKKDAQKDLDTQDVVLDNEIEALPEKA